MPTTTVRGIDLILVGSLGKETLSNDSFENLALGISGTTTIALTATDYTLTTDNQGEAMRMILVLTGTLTANVTVFVPAEGRVFVVDNRTTGAFTVTFTTATGSGFAVPQAERTFLYCDGTDVFPVGTGGGGGGGAPPDAPYLVSSAHSLLTGERVVTDTATVLWDHTTVGQSRATVPAASETAAGVLELATAAETQAGTDTTRAVTPAGLAAKVPSGTALSVARYAASGTTLEATPLTIDTTPLATLTDADLVVRRTSGTGSLALEGPAGTQRILAWRTGTVARWLLLATTGAEAGSNVGSDLQLIRRDDAGASLGTALHVQRSTGNVGLGGQTTFGTGATKALALGSGTAPTTSPADAVQLWAADRAGTAGKASLQVRTEDGTSHVLGDLSGIGTLCDATLGSGASYQALSVKGSLLAVGQSSVQERAQALIAPSWVVSTDASRTARLTLSVYDATAAREGLRLEADGSAARLGFLGAAAVVRQTVPAAATDPATTMALVNSVRTALVNFGLCV